MDKELDKLNTRDAPDVLEDLHVTASPRPSHTKYKRRPRDKLHMMVSDLDLGNTRICMAAS
jgi:hypothetical protein